jgi:hypothetical protein
MRKSIVLATATVLIAAVAVISAPKENPISTLARMITISAAAKENPTTTRQVIQACDRRAQATHDCDYRNVGTGVDVCVGGTMEKKPGATSYSCKGGKMINCGPESCTVLLTGIIGPGAPKAGAILRNGGILNGGGGLSSGGPGSMGTRTAPSAPPPVQLR